MSGRTEQAPKSNATDRWLLDTCRPTVPGTGKATAARKPTRRPALQRRRRRHPRSAVRLSGAGDIDHGLAYGPGNGPRAAADRGTGNGERRHDG